MEPGSLIEQAVDLTTRSLTLQKEGQDEDAKHLLDQALALHPLFLPALLAKIDLLERHHRFDEAMFSIRTAQAFAPHSAKLEDIRRQLNANAALWLQTPPQAQEQTDPDLLFLQGNLAMCDNNLTQAINYFRQVLKLSPDYQAAAVNLGNTLLKLNQPEKALEQYDKVLSAHHDNINSWFNRGNALQQLNLVDEALASYAQAILLRAEFPEARLEIAHCLLRSGHYAEGWEYFESRWQTSQLAPLRLSTNAPQWKGQADIKNKTILLWAEQGLGDVIQFVRFVPEVCKHAYRTYLRCPSNLQRLFSHLDSHILLLSENDSLPEHDLQCPLMSLPLALGKTLENLGTQAAYLHTLPLSRARWQKLLGKQKRKRIGLCWQGRQQGARNLTRDIPLSTLQPIFAIDADFIIVQKEVDDADAARLSRFPNVHMPTTDLGDLADTAALLDNLDLIVSADTMIAHLAGALGRPCHVLLRSFGEWRWLTKRNDSPWYPSLCLYRQTKLGDWSDPITRLCNTLAAITHT